MMAGRELAPHRFEITGILSRHELEILQVEIRRLGVRYGVIAKVLAIERVEGSLRSRHAPAPRGVRENPCRGGA